MNHSGTAEQTLTTFRIEINTKKEETAVSSFFVKAALQLGIQIKSCSKSRLFFIQGRISREEVEQIARTLLTDPVTEKFTVVSADKVELPLEFQVIEVTLLPGVTDPPAENLLLAAAKLNLTGISRAATGAQFRITGRASEDDLRKFGNELLANPVIQQITVNSPIAPPFVAAEERDETVETIPLRDLTPNELEKVSKERRLSLNLAEMETVQRYFQDEGRDPTDAELEMLAQTWSEHCVHKTFKASIQYDGPLPGKAPNSPSHEQQVDGLLNTYIRAATEEIDKPWVHSAFVDNAGIIAFDDEYDLAFKVETHNHPSALEPFGGANTGIGGVIRDLLGVSARPIANTDILCFGPEDLPEESLPAGVLHPRRVAEGVVHGIEDYGNKMGIPTVNGAVYYHEGYTANPLVYCGCLGILPHGSHPTGARDGDLIIALGGRTGRDGLRGATFSSMEMDTATSEIAGTAVQIGHPIMEKQTLEVVLRARDEKLYSAITDCGAGGFSSAVGEMGEKVGAKVQLDGAPLKYPGLSPWEIWLSEAQERMVMAVPQENWERLQTIAEGQNVEAICLGTFAATGRLTIHYGEKQVADIEMDFLHNGLPAQTMKAVWTAPSSIAVQGKPNQVAEEALLSLLAHPNIRSKEEIIRRFDHEVQGGTAVKPLVGVDNHGPADAAVIVPHDVQTKAGAASTDNAPAGAALGVGICPQFNALDPYAMAWAAIDEALRNVVAVGADPDRIAILDNFCWGNPNLPDRLGTLVRCSQGCYDAAIAYQTPFISGKDSLNNEYTGADGEKHAIPGTLLVSALGFVPDVSKSMTMDFKKPGEFIFLLGETKDELGGSHYYDVTGMHGGKPPQPVPGALERFRLLHQALQQGLVTACHDCSEGGLATALAEMALAGRLGADINFLPFSDSGITNETLLFAESLSRFVVTVTAENQAAFKALMAGQPLTPLGKTADSGVLRVLGMDKTTPVELAVAQLERAWRDDDASVFKHQISKQKEIAPVPTLSTTPRVLILHANGTNRDRDAALACELAGGKPEIIHINQLLNGDRVLNDYGMLVIPGGFSYGDDLGAGVLWSAALQHSLAEPLKAFVDDGRPVLGICNGFQTLVKAGLLPGDAFIGDNGRWVTLTYNKQRQFECRWVYLDANPNSPSLFTKGIDEPIYCPIAHGEGQLATVSNSVAQQLADSNLIAFSYSSGREQYVPYPANPNGSIMHIAGLCNPAGNVLGLMPHPENHIFPWQHPRFQRGERGLNGLQLFRNGIQAAK